MNNRFNEDFRKIVSHSLEKLAKKSFVTNDSNDQKKEFSLSDLKQCFHNLAIIKNWESQRILTLLNKEITDSYSTTDKLRELIDAGATLALILVDKNFYGSLASTGASSAFISLMEKLIPKVDKHIFSGVPITGDYLGTLTDYSFAFYFHDPRPKNNNFMSFMNGPNPAVFPYPCIVHLDDMVR